VPVYLLLAFGLAWAGVLVAHLAGASLANPLVQLPMAFAPAVAAVIVRRWVTREGFGDAALAPRFRQARRWYLLALLGPVLVLAVIVAMAAALGLVELGAARQLVPAGDVPQPLALLGWLAAPALAMPLFLGEELGWRSYLQQRVSDRPLRAALITGVMWAVWHYPLAFTDYVDYANPLAGVATWTLQSVLIAVILAWLFIRSRSVWVPCLAHAGNNLVIGTFSWALLVESGIDPATVDLLGLVPLALICAWIVGTGRLNARANAVASPAPAPVRAT
jgi:membrane protease YdiL (CAAX protease family)